MKILKILACTLALNVLLPTTANAHCAGKHTGNHPHCTGGEPPPPPPPPASGGSCSGDFPAFAYSVEVKDKRGRIINNELRVSNAEGSCQVLIHSDAERSYGDELAMHHNKSSGRFNIVFNHNSDKADTSSTGNRPNLQVLQFTVSPDGSNTQINESLPLNARKIYQYSRNSSAGRGILRNDIMGNSVVFSLVYGEDVGTKRNPKIDWYEFIMVIEDLDQCSADFGPEPDENCATIAFEAGVGLTAHSPTWGLDSNRIYFKYDWTSTRDEDPAIAMIDRAGPGASWSAPGAVRLASDDGAEFDWLAVAPRDFGSGQIEAMANNAFGMAEILNIGSSCTAAAATVQSCFSQGLATVEKSFPSLSYLGFWSAHPLQGTGANFLRIDDSDSFTELDPVSGNEVTILSGLPDRGVNFTADDSF